MHVENGLRDARAVTRRGILDALGSPAIVLVFSMTGFGSLARESGFDLPMAVAATAAVWGLPGQLAMAELYAAGSSLLAIVLAVSFANARFFPMAVSFLPLLRPGLRGNARLYALVQLLSVNSWAAGLRAFPGMAPALRRHYFTGFALTCIAAGLTGTTMGYLAIGAMPRSVALGLVFMNPVFFAVLFAGTRGRPAIVALLLGAFAGPPLHLVSPDWSLPATGLLAGTAAFLATTPRRRSR